MGVWHFDFEHHLAFCKSIHSGLSRFILRSPYFKVTTCRLWLFPTLSPPCGSINKDRKSAPIQSCKAWTCFMFLLQWLFAFCLRATQNYLPICILYCICVMCSQFIPCSLIFSILLHIHPTEFKWKLLVSTECPHTEEICFFTSFIRLYPVVITQVSGLVNL